MKILFLHEVGYLEKPIFEMHEFPEHLGSRGHEVAFADFPETRGTPQKSHFGTVVNGRVLANVNLKLYNMRALLPGIMGRLIAVFQAPLFFYRVLSSFKPDIVVSYSVPTSGWQAIIICRMRGVPVVFRALDVSHKIRKSRFAGLVKMSERFVYSNASWVSCNNPALREYCVALGAKEELSSVDYPPLDVSHFAMTDAKRNLRREFGIPPEADVILYMGSFFYFSGLTDVLQSLAHLSRKPILMLIGGGEQDAELRSMTENLKLEEYVRFTGFIGFKELPNYLSIANIAINPMVPALVSDKALPNKVLQYMASGLPIVTTELKGLSSVFPEVEGIVSVSEPGEVLATAVSMLVKKPELERLGESNRVEVLNNFDLDVAVSSLERRLAELSSKA